MAKKSNEIGIVGLGNMGTNIAKKMHSNGYSVVLYNRTPDKYAPFEGIENAQKSSDIKDFAKKLEASDNGAIIWVMLPGGDVTNKLMVELAAQLNKDDIVIDASNSIYSDSMESYKKLKEKGIFYLDVGCAGGPDDVLQGVSLMVGGDKAAYERSKEIFKIIAGKGAYGYVGGSGSGHMSKLVHNTIFYGIFPVYAEGGELLQSLQKDNPGMKFDTSEALRLLSKAPPINGGIMEAISTTMKKDEAKEEAPPMTVSSMVNSGIEKANKLGVKLNIIRSILNGYSSMSNGSRKIYAAAKKKLTGH